MPSSFDKVKNIFHFNVFLCESLRKKDVSYLTKFPEIFMTPAEIKVKKGILEYYNQNGDTPTIDWLRLDTDYTRFYDPMIIDIPLKELYRLAFNRGKASYARNELAQLEIGFDSFEKDFPIDKLAKVTQTILGTVTEPPLSIRTMDRDEIYKATAAKEGLPFMMKYVDDVTGGMQKGDLATIAARLKVGKTLLICHLAVNWARLGKKIAIASCEMPSRQLIFRMDSILGHFNPKLFRDGSAGDRLKTLKPLVKIELELIESLGGDILFVPRSQMSVSGLSSFMQETRADVLIVDGLYLLPSEDSGKMQGWERVKQTSNALKNMALTLNIPILATTQLNRQGAGSNMIPEIEAIAYSDAIAQDSDVVLFGTRTDNGEMQITVAANRHGEGLGGALLQFDWDYMSMQEKEFKTEKIVLGK